MTPPRPIQSRGSHLGLAVALALPLAHWATGTGTVPVAAGLASWQLEFDLQAGCLEHVSVCLPDCPRWRSISMTSPSMSCAKYGIMHHEKSGYALKFVQKQINHFVPVEAAIFLNDGLVVTTASVAHFVPRKLILVSCMPTWSATYSCRL